MGLLISGVVRGIYGKSRKSTYPLLDMNMQYPAKRRISMKKGRVTGRTAPAMVTIREAVRRAREEGMTVSEYAVRTWIRQGAIPVRRTGNRALLYYPSLLAFLCCADITQNCRDLNVVHDVLQKMEGFNHG